MHNKLSQVRRLAIAVAAATALLLGTAVTPAQAAAAPAQAAAKDNKGKIQVCKTVKGKSKNVDFHFVVKQRNGNKYVLVKYFALGKGECLLLKKLGKGQYTVAETKLPSGFELKNIKLKGNDGKFNVKKRYAVFKVKNDKTVVTFVNKCTAKKNPNCKA
jgi:hypothetical protein